MPSPSRALPGGLFGDFLRNRMKRLGIDVESLASSTGTTYEYARQLYRGLATPSPLRTKQLAQLLKVDESELLRLVLIDKLSKKHGSEMLELISKRPKGLHRIEVIWQGLSEDQRNQVVSLAQFLASRN